MKIETVVISFPNGDYDLKVLACSKPCVKYKMFKDGKAIYTCDSYRAYINPKTFVIEEKCVRITG